MGRFKAGDRVKILAGHPYWLGEHRNSVGEEGEGVYIGRAGKQQRGEHLVEVPYDDGETAELSFKGRELELLPEAEAWVPKVGDRVRVKSPACMRRGTPVGAEGVVTAIGGDKYFDIDLTHPSDGVISQLVNVDNVEPLPVAEQPAGLGADKAAFAPFRRGERIRCDDNRGAPKNFVEGEFYTVKSVDGARRDSLVWVEETDAAMCAYRFSPAPLTIEAGKFYRTRDGRKVGPALRDTSNGYGKDFPWRVGVYTYTDDGRVGFIEDHCDLLAEWVEPDAVATPEPAAPPAKFKVGDRVECLDDCDGQYHVGGVYEVSRVYRDFNDEWRIGTVRDDGGSTTNGWGAKHFKPAPAQAGAAGPSFIVARLTPSGQPRPNARPRVHTTLASAETEAQRLADRLGDEFAVYQRVSTRTVDAGPVPPLTDNLLDVLEDASRLVGAFSWDNTKQRHGFWRSQYLSGHLTPLGRAVLRKWIAEAESTPAEEAA